MFENLGRATNSYDVGLINFFKYLFNIRSCNCSICGSEQFNG